MGGGLSSQGCLGICGEGDFAVTPKTDETRIDRLLNSLEEKMDLLLKEIHNVEETLEGLKKANSINWNKIQIEQTPYSTSRAIFVRQEKKLNQ
jgi:hypothetical protein